MTDSLTAVSEHPGAYGEAFADVYDSWYQDISDVSATVEAIAALARGGPVLELGVGTGRVALPLAAATRPLVGLDGSPAMLERLRAKEQAELVAPVLADMAAIPFRSAFSVVFVAFNTFFNLASAEAQRACVAGVAAALVPGGRFVVEAFIPNADPADVETASTGRPDGAGGTVETTTVRDPADQTVRGISVHTTAAGRSTERPWTIRYLRPAQLDRLCAAEGLVLEERWASFRRDRFDPEGDRHVSCYRMGEPPLDRTADVGGP